MLRVLVASAVLREFLLLSAPVLGNGASCRLVATNDVGVKCFLSYLHCFAILFECKVTLKFTVLLELSRYTLRIVDLKDVFYHILITV